MHAGCTSISHLMSLHSNPDFCQMFCLKIVLVHLYFKKTHLVCYSVVCNDIHAFKKMQFNLYAQIYHATYIMQHVCHDMI